MLNQVLRLNKLSLFDRAASYFGQFFPKFLEPELPQSVYPIVIPVGSRFVTINEQGYIDGDFNHFQSFLKNGYNSRISEGKKVVYFLLLMCWKEQQLALQQYMASSPSQAAPVADGPKTNRELHQQLPTPHARRTKVIRTADGREIEVKYKHF